MDSFAPTLSFGATIRSLEILCHLGASLELSSGVGGVAPNADPVVEQRAEGSEPTRSGMVHGDS